MLRKSLGSGPIGLAGMRERTALSHLSGCHTGAHQKLSVLRPLLIFSKADLRQYCICNEVPWVEEPNNWDRKQLRTRHRAALQGMPAISASQAHGT